MKLKQIRLISQILFFILWIGIFWRIFPLNLIPADAFFDLDPLLGLIVITTSRVLLTGLLFGISTIIITLVFGRVFCGWFCPLGTWLDFIGWIGKRWSVKQPPAEINEWRRVKYIVLIILCTSALLGYQFLAFFDPIVIFTRVNAIFTDPGVYSIAHRSLPSRIFEGGFGIGLFFLLISLPSLVHHRFWCRIVCPLGGLLGFLSGWSLFRLETQKCTTCKVCLGDCPMAIRSHELSGDFSQSECIRCFKCVDACHAGDIVYHLSRKQKITDTDLSRRSFLTSLAVGAFAVPLLKRRRFHPNASQMVVRPPHSVDETVFRELCVRCGACMKACPTNALQPQLLEDGLDGLWTPHVVASIGGCVPDCNRCGSVCPTEAIGKVDSIPQKLSLKMGTAVYEAHYCITAQKEGRCGKCILICPASAIIAQQDSSFGPYPLRIDPLRCTGCGLCENICRSVTPYKSALILTAHGRNRPCFPVIQSNYKVWRYTC